MEYMFYGATDFNQDIGSWDVRNVTNMQYMFSSPLGLLPYENIPSFNQNIGNWNISNVANLTGMFILLDSDNYDALLIGWSQRTVQGGVTFDAGYSLTTGTDSPAYAARQILVDKGWTIRDGHGVIAPPSDNA